MLARGEGREDPRRADQRRRRAAARRVREALQRRARSSSAITHVSNALGTINPVKEMIAIAHAHGVPVLVDGAQAAPHLTVDVQDLDCDFYAFSGHKMCGPTGIGILYGKAAAAREDAALQGRRRHDPVGDVREDDLQHDPAQVRGRHAADRRGDRARRRDRLSERRSASTRIAAHEHRSARLRDASRSNRMPGVRIIGTAEHKAAVLSFAVEGVHPHDVGTLLNEEGVAVRTGHHCAQPVMQRFSVPATCARLVRVLQHDGGSRCARRAAIAQGAEGFRRDERKLGSHMDTQTALPGSDPRPQPQAAELGHARRTRRHQAEGLNPLCGDHI